MQPGDILSTEIDTSIVIATCSRVELLRDALASLYAEAFAFHAPVEFVIVDDGSTDGTANFLADWSQTTRVPVRVLRGPCSGVAAARNAGSFAARGKWIASFDDDQIAQPGWLVSLRQLADVTGVAVVGGSLHLQLPPYVALESLGPRVRKLLGEHTPWEMQHRYDSGVLPATNNVLIRRDVFDALQGYDPDFTEGGEDKDFFDRVRASGHELWFQPRARAWHVTPARRLSRDNLRWTALRVGAADARMDWRARGARLVPLKAAGRMVIAVLRDLPQWLAAKLTASRRLELEALCSLNYTFGYMMAAQRNGGPWQQHFLRSMNFRTRNGERQQ